MSVTSHDQPEQPPEADSVQSALEGLTTLRACLVAASEHLAKRLHHRLEEHFTGDDDATRYVTAPLLQQQGPLADTLLKARLLVALGCIESAAFHDIELLSELREKVVYSPAELEFSTPQVLQALAEFSQFDDTLLPMFTQRLELAPEDPSMRQPYLTNINQGIRSAFVLALSYIEQQLNAVSNS